MMRHSVVQKQIIVVFKQTPQNAPKCPLA